MTVLAFECFADQDLFLFLRDELGLALRKLHSYSQGEVINDLLVRNRADVAVVDEDPGASHHRRRDSLPVVGQAVDLEVRELGGRSLFIVRPDIERGFLEAMERVSLTPMITTNAAELHRRLAQSSALHADHQLFRAELGRLRRASRERRMATFGTEIEDRLRRRQSG